MDQFQAFNPDSTSGFGDYYDPREDPRQATTIAKYGGRINYCAEPIHKGHYGGQAPHGSHCACAVCVGYKKKTWDTTNDYDYQYQDSTNFRHGTQCVPPHRGTHDTRVPPLRPAWGTEQMTTPEAPLDLASYPQCYWVFIFVLVVSFIVNAIFAMQLRSLTKEMSKLRRGDTSRIF